MKFRVPFTYAADCVRKGFRKQQTVTFHEWLEVEIEESDDEDAPVAARWTASPPEGADYPTFRMKWGPVPEDGFMETRWKDGRHWWPVLTAGHWNENARKLVAGDLAAACLAGADRNNPLMLNFFTPKGFGENSSYTPEDDEFRSVENSSREREIERIRARARSLTVADGKIWKAGAEPVLHLHDWIRLDDGGIEAFIKVVPANSEDIKEKGSVFRLDRFDDAVDASLVLREGEDPMPRSVNEGRRPEIFVSDSIRYADEASALLEGALKLVGSMESDTLGKTPKETALAWFGLRDSILGAMKATADLDERATAVEPALDAFAEALGRENEKGKRAAALLERWNGRPIGRGEAMGGRGPRM